MSRPTKRARYRLPWLSILLTPAHAIACSTCLSGDPTLTTMGLEKPYGDRKRVSLAALYRTERVGEHGLDQRKLTERRTTLGLTYWPNARFAMGVRLPWTNKKLEDSNLSTQETSAPGDVDLDLRFYLWQDAHRAEHLVGLQGGLRIPTAKEVSSGSTTLDSDVQPGSGLWMPSIGAWYGRFNYPWMVYASANYTVGANKGFHDFEYGNAVNASANVQYGFGYQTALQLGIDMRWSGRDRHEGEIDGDSGGFIAFAVPGLVYTLGGDLLLSAKLQLPVVAKLRGDHEEEALYHLGLSYDF